MNLIHLKVFFSSSKFKENKLRRPISLGIKLASILCHKH